MGSLSGSDMRVLDRIESAGGLTEDMQVRALKLAGGSTFGLRKYVTRALAGYTEGLNLLAGTYCESCHRRPDRLAYDKAVTSGRISHTFVITCGSCLHLGAMIYQWEHNQN